MRKERWAMSEEESALPFALNSYDELIADARDPETGERLELGIIVYRNGKVSNRWAGGTVGVPADVAELADAEETLCHTNGETTDVWRDVEVDDSGSLIRLLPTGV